MASTGGAGETVNILGKLAPMLDDIAIAGSRAQGAMNKMGSTLDTNTVSVDRGVKSYQAYRTALYDITRNLPTLSSNVNVLSARIDTLSKSTTASKQDIAEFARQTSLSFAMVSTQGKVMEKVVQVTTKEFGENWKQASTTYFNIVQNMRRANDAMFNPKPVKEYGTILMDIYSRMGAEAAKTYQRMYEQQHGFSVKTIEDFDRQREAHLQAQKAMANAQMDMGQALLPAKLYGSKMISNIASGVIAPVTSAAGNVMNYGAGEPGGVGPIGATTAALTGWSIGSGVMRMAPGLKWVPGPMRAASWLLGKTGIPAALGRVFFNGIPGMSLSTATTLGEIGSAAATYAGIPLLAVGGAYEMGKVGAMRYNKELNTESKATEWQAAMNDPESMGGWRLLGNIATLGLSSVYRRSKQLAMYKDQAEYAKKNIASYMEEIASEKEMNRQYSTVNMSQSDIRDIRESSKREEKLNEGAAKELNAWKKSSGEEAENHYKEYMRKREAAQQEQRKRQALEMFGSSGLANLSKLGPGGPKTVDELFSLIQREEDLMGKNQLTQQMWTARASALQGRGAGETEIREALGGQLPSMYAQREAMQRQLHLLSINKKSDSYKQAAARLDQLNAQIGATERETKYGVFVPQERQAVLDFLKQAADQSNTIGQSWEEARKNVQAVSRETIAQGDIIAKKIQNRPYFGAMDLAETAKKLTRVIASSISSIIATLQVKPSAAMEGAYQIASANIQAGQTYGMAAEDLAPWKRRSAMAARASAAETAAQYRWAQAVSKSGLISADQRAAAKTLIAQAEAHGDTNSANALRNILKTGAKGVGPEIMNQLRATANQNQQRAMAETAALMDVKMTGGQAQYESRLGHAKAMASILPTNLQTQIGLMGATFRNEQQKAQQAFGYWQMLSRTLGPTNEKTLKAQELYQTARQGAAQAQMEMYGGASAQFEAQYDQFNNLDESVLGGIPRNTDILQMGIPKEMRASMRYGGRGPGYRGLKVQAGLTFAEGMHPFFEGYDFSSGVGAPPSQSFMTDLTGQATGMSGMGDIKPLEGPAEFTAAFTSAAGPLTESIKNLTNAIESRTPKNFGLTPAS
jgi:predicted nucleic acid-binding protein